MNKMRERGRKATAATFGWISNAATPKRAFNAARRATRAKALVLYSS